MVDEDDGKRCEVYVTRCSESNESSIAIVGMLVPDVQCGLFTLAIFIFLLCDLTDVLGGGASFAVFATLLPVLFSLDNLLNVNEDGSQGARFRSCCFVFVRQLLVDFVRHEVEQDRDHRVVPRGHMHQSL